MILWAWHVDVVLADLLYEGQPTDEFVVRLGSGSAKYTILGVLRWMGLVIRCVKPPKRYAEEGSLCGFVCKDPSYW